MNLDLVKNYLKIDDANAADDNIIQGLITAARVSCESFNGHAYLEQAWDLWLDKFPDKNYINIPLPPLQSVTIIKYYGADDVEYIFSDDHYDVDNKSFIGRVVLKYGQAWPTVALRPSNAVVIRFVAGYATYSSIVSVDKTAVTKIEGDDFQIAWQAGKTVTIAGKTYRIASVESASSLTLMTSTETQNEVLFLADDVPEPKKQAMLIDIKLMYDDYSPEEKTRLQQTRDALLWPDRVVNI